MITLNPVYISTEEVLFIEDFGDVYAYNDPAQKDLWAVKAIKYEQKKSLDLYIKEAFLGFNHDHQNILWNQGFDLIENFNEQGSHILIKIPRMESSLKHLIIKSQGSNTKIPFEKIIQYFYSIANGLAYLEKKRIIHNNINPNTIFIDKIKRARIGGLRFGRIGLADPEKLQVNRLYAAPERLSGEKVDKDNLFKSDVWSLGATVVEICLGKIETKEIKEGFQVFDVEKSLQEIKKLIGFGVELAEFLGPLFDLPQNRPTFKRICEELLAKYNGILTPFLNLSPEEKMYYESLNSREDYFEPIEQIPVVDPIEKKNEEFKQKMIAEFDKTIKEVENNINGNKYDDALSQIDVFRQHLESTVTTRDN